MLEKLTPEIIAAAIFALAGLGTYLKTKGAPKLAEGAYKIESPLTDSGRQLERIAQALEDMVAQNQDSFQKDIRDRLSKLDEIDEAIDRLRDERRDRHDADRGEPKRRI